MQVCGLSIASRVALRSLSSLISPARVRMYFLALSTSGDLPLVSIASAFPAPTAAFSAARLAAIGAARINMTQAATLEAASGYRFLISLPALVLLYSKPRVDDSSVKGPLRTAQALGDRPTIADDPRHDGQQRADEDQGKHHDELGPGYRRGDREARACLDDARDDLCAEPSHCEPDQRAERNHDHHLAPDEGKDEAARGPERPQHRKLLPPRGEDGEDREQHRGNHQGLSGDRDDRQDV